MDVLGNINGIKKNILKKMKDLYDFSSENASFIDEELLDKLALLTEETSRELAVYINRRKKIEKIAVGDSKTVLLPFINARRSLKRLSGITCIHTHPNGDSRLSDLDLSSLIKYRFDLMIAVGVLDGNITELSIGIISGFDKKGQYLTEVMGPFDLKSFSKLEFLEIIYFLESLIEKYDDKKTDTQQEVACLAGLDSNTSNIPIEESLEELGNLAKTAGAKIVDKVFQKRKNPDSRLYLGSGIINDLKNICQTNNASMVIFDDELSPAQQRNLEHELGLKVIDRNALILDIFAQRANTHEGKLQVELAQLKYNLPRLMGQGLVLSRLGGGIGTRGPGETKLETDRRHIRTRISEIEKNLKKIKDVRNIQLQKRSSRGYSLISLVGYTNAGKSTLLNALTDSDVYVEDELFATLDPTTRQLYLPSGKKAMLTDTVGFIRKLPHQLIAAFRATLEEVVEADLLLHVVDASFPFYQEQSDAVYKVLEELKIGDKKIITVFNKIDKIQDKNILQKMLRMENSVAISAQNHTGFNELLKLIDENLSYIIIEDIFLVPYDKANIVAKMHETTNVLTKEYIEDGVLIKIAAAKDLLKPFEKFRKDMS